MRKIIEELFKFNRCLLGEGYDNALEYIKHLIKLDVIEIPSGTKLETWTVPDEWTVKDAWVKHKNKKVIDYKKTPLSLVVGSVPFKGKVKGKEMKNYLFIKEIEKLEMSDCPTCKVDGGIDDTETPYIMRYYEKDWGFTIPRKEIKKFDGEEYEVFIDTEFKPSTMKIGVHTIPGKTDREILLFAHLDHPYQANDNLSGVACLIDMAKGLKKKGYDHTIKLIFCPETIGSIGYALTQDISKVDFVIAVDMVGNDNNVLFQWAYNEKARINSIVNLAMTWNGVSFRMGKFRHIIGSDEYFFNDPKIGIPGVLLSRYPYAQYHSSLDIPKYVISKRIKEIQDVIHKTVEIYEKDYIPIRNFKGPLFRTKYGMHTISKPMNRDLDYLIYGIDGKKYLSQLVVSMGISYDYAYDHLEKLVKDKLIKKKCE